MYGRITQVSAVNDESARCAASRQTKVDAQCDKLVTELSWQHSQWSMFSSYSKLFVESRQFQPTPPAFGASIGVTPFEFCRNLQHQKTRVPGLSCGTVCMILCLAISVEHWLVTDRQTDMTKTYTSLAWRRAVLIHLKFAMNTVFFTLWVPRKYCNQVFYKHHLDLHKAHLQCYMS